MQDLDVKRGHWKNVDLDAIFTEWFDSYTKEEGEKGTWYVGKGPALKSFRVCLVGKSNLLVDIEEDKDASMDEAMRAIKIKNNVLEESTGFTAKQRAKRAQEAAKKSA